MSYEQEWVLAPADKQSKELTEFYQAYLAWVQDGAPFGAKFVRDSGLCLNLFRMYGRDIELYKEMKRQFQCANLDDSYPFDDKGEYYFACMNNCCHLNIKRIQWVTDHAEG